MKQETNSKKKAALKIAAGVVVGLIAGGLGAVALTPEPAPVVQIKEVSVPVEVEVIKEVIRNVTVEVPIETASGSDDTLEIVLNHLFDADGEVQYITDEFDSDEVEEIADAFVFINDNVKLASDLIKKELADELDREEVNGTSLDEDDVERIRINDDLDEVTVEDFDWKDKEVDLIFDVRFEHDDVDYTAVVKVEVRDGELDDISIESIDLE